MDSSNELVAEVAAAAGLPTHRLKPVPELVRPAIGPVPPIGILHALGRATSSLPALGQAGAAGLVGLTALRTTSHWAILKYLWAFHNADPRLHLSPIARQLRRHERSLFSEQLAIGLATHLVEEYVVAPSSSPEIVDIDAVFAHPVLGPLVAPVAAHRPDYLVRSTPSGSTPELVVLEVKGNSRGRSQSVQQLARGVAQVLTVPAVPGHTLRRIVVGAAAVGARVTCYAVEVVPAPSPERKRWLNEMLTNKHLDRREAPLFPPSMPNRQPDDVPDELSPEAVAQAIEAGEDARLLTYAGWPMEAEQFSRSDPAIGRRSGDGLSAQIINDVEYLGSRVQVETGDSSLEVFTGVQGGVLAALGDVGSNTVKRQRRKDLAAKVLSNKSAASRWEEGPRLTNRLVIEALDGTVLSLAETPNATRDPQSGVS